MESNDKYVHDMDWVEGHQLTNYDKWRCSLISDFFGKKILEVGSGNKSFTHQIISNSSRVEELVSVEPSPTLFNLYKDKLVFPAYVSFQQVDFYDINESDFGLFNTIIFSHVLEHLENDRSALEHAEKLLKPEGYILIQVPAFQFLFSVHDEMLGHHRRYNKKSLLSIVDKKKFLIRDIWYQDTLGLLGSLYYFKIKKIKLKSEKGENLLSTSAVIYDKYVIPFQSAIEKHIRLPFGLSLTAVLQNK